MAKNNLSEEMVVPFDDGSNAMPELEKEAEEGRKQVADDIEEAEKLVDEVNHPKDTDTPEEVELPITESLKLNESVDDNLFDDLSEAIVEVLTRYNIEEEDIDDVAEIIKSASEYVISGLDYLVEKLETKAPNTEQLEEEFKITMGLDSYKPWSGAVSTWDKIVGADKVEELDELLEEIYPEGLSETELNDILWFENDWILSSLGLSEEEEEE